MMQLKIRNYGGEVHFHETLLALMDRALGGVKFHKGAEKARQQLETHVTKKANQVSKRRSMVSQRKKGGSNKVVPTFGGGTTSFDGSRQYTIADEFASRKIQVAYRKY